MVNINNGQSYGLCLDHWARGVPMHSFPVVFSFIKKKTTTLAEGKLCTHLHNLFHIPLAQQAHDHDLQLVELSESPDSWSYIWNSRNLSVAKAYMLPMNLKLQRS